MKHFFKKLQFDTEQNNLVTLEPKLTPHVQDFDFFSVIDLTEMSFAWVEESQVREGAMIVQSLHTTCVVAINELDEPCLLGDINQMLRDWLPKTKSYLHNGPLRSKNLCEDDYKCDRNADAHLKAFLFGAASQSLVVHEARPVYGRWQRLCLIEFDGPRKREIAVQVFGV